MSGAGDRLRKIIWLTAGVLCAAQAQAAFDFEQSGTRALGMAGAFSAWGDDPQTVFYNPAGLAQLDVPMLSAEYVRPAAGLTESVLADNRVTAAIPWGTAGTSAFSWARRAWMNVYAENAFLVSHGLALDSNRTWLVGMTLRAYQIAYDDLESVQDNPYLDPRGAAALGVDVGALTVLADRVRAALSLLNLNQPDLALGDAADRLPMQVRLGAGYIESEWSAGVEGLVYADRFRLAAGGESWWFARHVGLRAGAAVGDRGLGELSAGASLRLPGDGWTAQVDYGLRLPLGESAAVGATHAFNLTLIWGEPEALPSAQAEIERGERAYARGSWDEALAAWENAAEQRPEDADLSARIQTLRATLKRRHEAELILRQARAFEQSGSLQNAAGAYRRVLALEPGQPEAAAGLAKVLAAQKTVSQQEQAEKSRQERAAAAAAQQRNLLIAQEQLVTAEGRLDRAEQNQDLRREFPRELAGLKKQLDAATSDWELGEAEKAQAAAETVMADLDKLLRALGRRLAVQRRSSSAGPAAQATPVVAAAVPTAVPTRPSAAVLTPAPTARAQARAPAPDEALRKRARGAYGRAVKLMLDIEKKQGQRWFPKTVTGIKEDLAKAKAALSREDYEATIALAGSLYPRLEALQRQCDEKQKVNDSMPTHW